MKHLEPKFSTPKADIEDRIKNLKKELKTLGKESNLTKSEIFHFAEKYDLSLGILTRISRGKL